MFRFNIMTLRGILTRKEAPSCTSSNNCISSVHCKCENMYIGGIRLTTDYPIFGMKTMFAVIHDLGTYHNATLSLSHPSIQGSGCLGSNEAFFRIISCGLSVLCDVIIVSLSPKVGLE